jgi:hypothetical protein
MFSIGTLLEVRWTSFELGQEEAYNSLEARKLGDCFRALYCEVIWSYARDR